MDEKLKIAYATAMRACHESGRVEMHLSTDVVEHLRSLCSVPDPLATQRSLWGFPVVEVPGSERIEVHVVQVIA